MPAGLRTFVAGGSSGGALALAVALRAAEAAGQPGGTAVRAPDAVFAVQPPALHPKAMQALPERWRRPYDASKWADAAVLESGAMESLYGEWSWPPTQQRGAWRRTALLPPARACCC